MTVAGATAIAPLVSRSAWATLSRAERAAVIRQALAESLTEPMLLPDRSFASYERALQRARPSARQRAASRTLRLLERRFAERRGRMSTWPDDDKSIDYRHLLSLGSTGSASPAIFTLNHGTLARIAEANAYTPRLQEFRRVMFGLRGCEIVEASGTYQPTVRLKESTPDHFGRRCVIGIWDRFDARIAVFSGSTVPNRLHVELHRQYARWRKASRDGRRRTQVTDPGVWRTHLLPQGLYDYRVGTHLPQADTSRQPGALMLAKPAPVLRAASGLSYTHTEQWDYLDYPPGNGIHASVYLTDFLKFSSAGSQTVYGRYLPAGRRATGPWGHFRNALELEPIDPATGRTAGNGQEIPYMLTTGREARVHAFSLRRDITPLLRLRYGSRGPRAEAAQRALAGLGLLKSDVDGKFGRDSAVAVLELQRKRGLPRDAVITPELRRALGISE